MQTTPRFGQVLTAMVTPFENNLRIDESQVERLVNHLIANGNDGLIICGTTGESATLSHDEKILMFSLVKKYAAGRAKLIAGTGSNNTADSIHLTRHAEELGMDGALLITPYYNKPSQEGLLQHFSAIARSTTLPIMLYNVPGRTGVNMTAETTIRTAQSAENIVAIKEASSDLAQCGEIARAVKNGFEIYCGDDNVNLPMLSIGGVGTVSVISHVAGKALKQMHEAFASGKNADAQKLHLSTLPLTKALFCTSNPVPVKYALQKLGVLENDLVRLPLIQASSAERAIVDEALKQFGLI